MLNPQSYEALLRHARAALAHHAAIPAAVAVPGPLPDDSIDSPR